MANGKLPPIINIGLHGKVVEDLHESSEIIKEAVGEYPSRANAIEVLALLGQATLMSANKNLDLHVGLVCRGDAEKARSVIFPSIGNLIREFYDPQEPKIRDE